MSSFNILFEQISAVDFTYLVDMTKPCRAANRIYSRAADSTEQLAEQISWQRSFYNRATDTAEQLTEKSSW